MYVYVYVSMYVYMCMSMYMCVCVCICMYVCIYVYVYVYVYVCMYICVYVCPGMRLDWAGQSGTSGCGTGTSYPRPHWKNLRKTQHFMNFDLWPGNELRTRI